MTNAQHQPGPWAKDRHGTVRDRDGNPVTLADSGFSFASGNDHPERHANSQIALAAPDLLTSLQWAMERLHAPTPGVRAVCPEYAAGWDQARAVIAAATGAQP